MPSPPPPPSPPSVTGASAAAAEAKRPLLPLVLLLLLLPRRRSRRRRRRRREDFVEQRAKRRARALPKIASLLWRFKSRARLKLPKHGLESDWRGCGSIRHVTAAAAATDRSSCLAGKSEESKTCLTKERSSLLLHAFTHSKWTDSSMLIAVMLKCKCRVQ